MSEVDEARAMMIDEQLIKRGIQDVNLLKAMQNIHREDFVPLDRKHLAYWDGPLSIGFGQTISQPYIVALMIEALQLKKDDRVLEIGTGSGYNAAVMSLLAKEVHTVEVVRELYVQVEDKLNSFKNVKLHYGDGHRGVPDMAPFDKIILTAAPTTFPEMLWDQLVEGGIMVAPIGPTHDRQKLFRYHKNHGKRISEFVCDVIFVPMIHSSPKTQKNNETNLMP